MSSVSNNLENDLSEFLNGCKIFKLENFSLNKRFDHYLKKRALLPLHFSFDI